MIDSKRLTLGMKQDIRLVGLSTCEAVLSSIVEKLEKQEVLTEDEREFLSTFEEKCYPVVGGSLSSSVVLYDKKLKPVYKRLATLCLKNSDDINYSDIVFLIHYFSSDMCKEYNLNKISVAVTDHPTFRKEPAAAALHEKYSDGTNIVFNPRCVKEYAEKKKLFNLISDVFHELEHEVQGVKIFDEKLTDAQALLWAKEHIFRIAVEDYYWQNYYNLFYERDAYDYMDKRAQKVFEEYAGIKKDISNKYEYNLNIKQKNIKDGKEVQAIDLLDAVTNSIVKRDPSKLDKFKVLKNIYDDKGNKKLFIQIKRELELKENQEIMDNPSLKEEIHRRYTKLIKDVSETDYDLLLQRLFLEVDELDKDSFVYTNRLITIEQIFNKSYVSYDQIINKFNRRKEELFKLIKEDKHNKEYLQELKDVIYLFDCMVKYNKKFRDKYDEKLEESRKKLQIENMVNRNISNKKFVYSNGELIMKHMSPMELDNSYDELKKKLQDLDLDPETLKLYIEYLDRLYGKYKEDIKNPDPQNIRY